MVADSEQENVQSARKAKFIDDNFGGRKAKPGSWEVLPGQTQRLYHKQMHAKCMLFKLSFSIMEEINDLEFSSKFVI